MTVVCRRAGTLQSMISRDAATDGVKRPNPRATGGETESKGDDLRTGGDSGLRGSV